MGTLDLANVARFDNGLMRASSLAVNCCDGCNSIHLDFKDKAGNTFVSGSVSLDHAMTLATRLIEMRDLLVKRAGGAPRQ